jgi:RNA methyltransferase, TrmH family
MITPPYDITSPHNPRVGMLRSLHSAKGRVAAEMLLLEGPHLIIEAFRADVVPALVLWDPAEVDDPLARSAVARWNAAGVETLTAPAAIVARAAETQTPQGIVAALPFAEVTPDRVAARRVARPRSLVLVLDALSDPGNAGTILRAALAADVERVILTPGAVDIWNPKVVRAAAGAHLRLPIVAEHPWEAIAAAYAGSWQILVAEGTATIDYVTADLTRPTVLIIGNEAHGPSVQALAITTERIFIPMANDVESLNAAIAASIILFEATRQRREQ